MNKEKDCPEWPGQHSIYKWHIDIVCILFMCFARVEYMCCGKLVCVGRGVTFQ